MQSIANPVLIDVALQGGGSHGAFTWGVLDRMLEEPQLDPSKKPGDFRAFLIPSPLTVWDDGQHNRVSSTSIIA